MHTVKPSTIAYLLFLLLLGTPAVAEPAQEPGTARVIAGTDGFAIESNDGAYRLGLGAVVQIDGRFVTDDPAPVVNTFTIRKLRPVLNGRVARYFDYRLATEFAGGTPTMLDAYFEIRFSPKLRVRAGKDKTPVGYEVLVGDSFLLFPDRGLPSSLLPNRDVGIQAQGDFARGTLVYTVGVFNGVPDGVLTSGELDANASKDLAGRVAFAPFRATTAATHPLNNLGIHLGASHGRASGTLPSFRTSSGQTYFSYATSAVADGNRDRVTPGLFYYYGPLWLFTEYARSTQTVARASIGHRIANEAWGAAASWVVTGEAASERGVRPRNTFDPAEGQWGALQFVARYGSLKVDGDAFEF